MPKNASFAGILIENHKTATFHARIFFGGYNMVLLGALGLFAFLLAQAGAAPAKDTDETLYQVIERKCPSVVTFPQKEAEQEFKSCKSWKEIKAVDSLAEKSDVLCLIYYNAFVTYCSKTKSLNISVPKDLNYNMSMLCDNLDLIGNGSDESEQLRKVLKNKEGCKQVCSDPMEYVIPTCLKAFYYVHLNAPELQAIQRKPIDSGSPQQEAGTQPLHSPSAVGAVLNLAEAHSPVVSTSSKTALKSSSDAAKPGSVDQSNPINPDASSALGMAIVPNGSTAAALGVAAKSTLQGQSAPEAPAAPSAAENSAKAPPAGVQSGPATQGQDERPPKPVNQPSSTSTQGQVPPVAAGVEEAEAPHPQSVKTKEATAGEAPAAAAAGKVDPNAGGDQPESAGNDDKKVEAVEETGGIPIDDEMGGAGNDDGNDQDYQMEKESNPMKPSYSEAAADPSKPGESNSVNYKNEPVEEGDSYFFTFFMLLCVVFIVGYISYHNKQKILALILEGRRGKRQYRSRRPNSANYHKLDTNLEEAITSSTVNKNTNNVIY